MEIINKYFESLRFKYIKEQQNYAIYVAAIDNLLGGDKRQFVIVFVSSHLGIQDNVGLNKLPWTNLQTRLCPTSTYNVRPQPWKPPNDVINLDLKIVNRDDNYSTYTCADTYMNFPFEILMIHSPTKKTTYQFPNLINLYWSINQFNTIFNYVGDQHPMLITQNPQTQYISTKTPQSQPTKNQHQDFELI